MSNLTNSAKLIEEMESKAYSADVIKKDNTTAFTPTWNYHPATKKYVDDTAAGKVSNTAYDASTWDWVENIAPSKNAIRDKLAAMDETIWWKQDSISDLSTIRAWAWKWATAVQPWDNISTLTNNSWFITKAVSDLTNYYTKTETYTKTEVNSLVQNFQWFEIVATLPTTDIKTNVIYLKWPSGSGTDQYEEYVYSNNAWVKVWDTSVDLTNYFNKSTNTSDNITQWSTNLFVSSSEKTLWNNKTRVEMVTQAQYDNIWDEKLTNGVLYWIIQS